jgi:hypothetical protein
MQGLKQGKRGSKLHQRLGKALKKTRLKYKTPELRLGKNLALSGKFQFAPGDTRMRGPSSDPQDQLEFARMMKDRDESSRGTPHSGPKGSYAGLNLRGTFEENINSEEETLSEKLTRYLNENK